jgi:hypothetical protein
VTNRLRWGLTSLLQMCGGRSHTSSKFHTSHTRREEVLSNYKPVISTRHADKFQIIEVSSAVRGLGRAREREVFHADNAHRTRSSADPSHLPVRG